MRAIYQQHDLDDPTGWVDDIIEHFADAPARAKCSGRPNDSGVAQRDPRLASSAPFKRATEAINNLTKRIKRVAFGFRQLKHFRIRALLYAGKPNWDPLATLTPR